MSKILSIPLSNKSAKPIFNMIMSTNKQIKCMLDTGADMPVWCGSEGLLKIVFPEVQLVDKKYLLSGFGRRPEVVDVYKIPEFFIRNGNESLAFHNLYVSSSFGRNFGCDLILSATMFKHMDYSILNRKRSTSILEIKYDRNDYYTHIIANQNYSEFIEKIFSFTSGENTQMQADSEQWTVES